jgi:hypothetical protein
MERALKVFALTVGLTAFAVLLFFGFAIWVFIPLFPAAIVYLVAVYGIKRTATFSARYSEKERDKAA